MAPRPLNLPVIPLAVDTVLLPGNGLRIPFDQNRPDIPALLSNVYSRQAGKSPTQRYDNVHVICVPLASPLLTRNGQKMIDEDPKRKKVNKERGERGIPEPADAKADDLFLWGTAAKISGVEGRGSGDFSLIVEGISRVRIHKVTQEKPYFEAEVVYESDGRKLTGPL
jgi:ATP-dependent Lon protease